MTITEDTIFGEWLLDEMEKLGISVKNLAELSGITAPGIRSLLYQDRQPKMETMFKLARALGKKIIITEVWKE